MQAQVGGESYPQGCKSYPQAGGQAARCESYPQVRQPAKVIHKLARWAGYAGAGGQAGGRVQAGGRTI